MTSTSDVPPAPAVSVVMATYNRSEALRHAIASVIRSTLADWELIVVGDACTDDSAAVVGSFGDRRIRWINLAERCGDQSGPNAAGIALSRGRYVAFLNHDDLYFPDHLATCVAELDGSGADLVWSASAWLLTERERTPSGRFLLSGIPPAHVYSPNTGCFASTWVFRRELAGRVGPWRSPNRTFVAPSQDWLFRAWRMGAVLRFVPRVGLVRIPAAERPGVYGRRDCPDQAWMDEWMTRDPGCRERVLEEAALNEATARAAAIDRPRLWSLRRILLRPVYALLLRAGVNPASLAHLVIYGRRGNYGRFLRTGTGAD